jgi:FdhD protein
MEPNRGHKIFRLEKGMLRPQERRIVSEFPLRLTVNGRELATLVASPHQLNFLVAGFFRLQGFIESLDDLLSLGICEDFGAAFVRIRTEVPERLRPTLTSGCGTGIAFDLPQNLTIPTRTEIEHFTPASIFALMRELAKRAQNYSAHGGIHSAALGDGRELLLYAEDLGRHNTLDRIAGEALFKGVETAGRMLVTSGRISTEMVAKSSRLGITLIASRTSPTDQAVRLAEEAGITLLGYARGDSFEVYTHPQRLAVETAPAKISGITGVILAGGESLRMGCDKSLLPIDGARFIDHIYRRMDTLFDEVIIVTNSPGLYQDIPCRKVPDTYFRKGSLAGIHSGLHHAQTERIFVVACDMPLLSAELIRYICTSAEDAQVVIPKADDGLQPLHALYHKSCLAAVEEVLNSGRHRIIEFFPRVRVHAIDGEELAQLDPQGVSFRNINTPQEYFTLREGHNPESRTREDQGGRVAADNGQRRPRSG